MPNEQKHIQEADWLKLDKSQFSQNSLVIGNPPFGEQNSLAIRFFNEAANFCKGIGFILPKSFQKSSIQNRLNLYFWIEKSIELPKDAFLFHGENYGVPCVFQYWTRKKEKRSKEKLKTTSDYFAFVDKSNAEIRIPRVGGNAGKATLKLEGAKTSNYFIKNNSTMTNEEFVTFVNKLTFPSINNTVGPKSLSKGELISIFEENVSF